MSEARNELAGRLTEGGHELDVRVYYEDTDFTGVVYHGRFLNFFERGRSDYLRLLGIHHAELKEGRFGESLAFAVRKIDVDFFLPAEIDDVLVVRSRFTEAKGARIEILQEIYKGEQLISAAKVLVVVINLEGRPRRLPAEVLAKLQ